MMSQETIFQATLNDLLTRFYLRIVKQIYVDHGAGAFEWPFGDYKVSVFFDETKKTGMIPFILVKIGQRSNSVIGKGKFFTRENDKVLVVDNIHGDEHIGAICSMLDLVLRENEGLDSKSSLANEPPVIHDDDINDAWIDWYRKEVPTATYSKAVAEATSKIRRNVADMQAILNKHLL